MANREPLNHAVTIATTKIWLSKYILSAGISPLEYAILIKFDKWLVGKEYDVKNNNICDECLGRLSRTNTHIDGILQSAKICNDCNIIIPDKKVSSV